MCGVGVHSILVLPLVARHLETINVCIWRTFVVYRPLLKILVFSLGVLKYVICLCKGCNRCCVLCLNCDAWSCRCSCMGSMRVSFLQM